MGTDAQLTQYFAGMWPHLDEHARRLVAAGKAVELGYGGISRVSRACGLSRVTLTKGVEELQAAPLAPGRIRHEGGGRHALTSNDPGLMPALDGMVEPTARGDPQSPLRWTCKSARTLAAELTARHHPVSHTKITQLLREGGYSLQGNRKTEEGDDHPDRDAQFRHINCAVKLALAAGEPVISVDTKKKELIGNYQNRGRQWRKTGTADKVNGHDFPGPEVPRAYPYGIYDLGRNAGFVNVGTDHDTGAFAVVSRCAITRPSCG
jgi:Rhodopirellula transposase DDE domain